MIVLGVTGGIGSGKTVVSRMLEEMGARVFHADSEARTIMQSDPEVQAALQDMFGSDVYLEGGELNRGFIAARVFSQPDELRRLNALVHPRVFEAFERARDQAREDGVELLVHEAALIFESGGDKYMDAVLVVDTPEQTRIDRVVERDGIPPEAVRARIQHQMPADELSRRADYVITNDGNLTALRAQVEQLMRELRCT